MGSHAVRSTHAAHGAPADERPQQRKRSLTSRVSFWALVLAACGLGVVFYHIMRPFLAPVFLATVLAILFRPVSERLAHWCGDRPRCGALATVLLLFGGIAVLSVLLFLTGSELMATGRQFAEFDLANNPTFQRIDGFIQQRWNGLRWSQFGESITKGFETVTSDILARTAGMLEDAVQLLIGAAVMALALFYFLAQGPAILHSAQRISPFDEHDEWLLFKQFASISRGVVIGIFVCAFTQAALLGVGLAVAGFSRVWLLMGATLLFSMIPIIGAAGVYVPCAAWLLWNGDVGKGVLLALYGLGVVSTSDNLVRAYILHESSKMHPLLALLSALGGLKVVGLWGIFLGPVVAAFFFSLLKIVHDRLLSYDDRQAAAGQN